MLYIKQICLFLLLTVLACRNRQEPAAPATHVKRLATDSNTRPAIDSTNTKQSPRSLYSIARVDERASRVFVVIAPSACNNLQLITRITREIKKKYSFGALLNISFVADAKYAGYKDELEMNAGISYAEFYANYLGEYEAHSKEYWTYPALPDKKELYLLD